MFRTIVVASFLFGLLSSAPNAQAQTTIVFNSEAEFRVYALKRIAELQALIEELKATIAERRRLGEDFESFILDDEDTLRARFFVDEDPWSVDRSYRAHWNRFLTLVPDAYDDYFDEFVVFDNDDQPIDAFVETLPPYTTESWRLGLSTDVIDMDVDGDLVDELLVHEFGHIVSYEARGDEEDSEADCHRYFKERFDCPPLDSYLIEFADRFWSDTALTYALRTSRLADPSAAVDTYYERNSTSFVSDYAAFGPEEDFAETFAYFILDSKPTGNTVADKKVRFFYQFPYLLEPRDEMRQNID